ncbi:MAG: hypothetical protein RLY31_2936 [Bacteroidota bacterium]|jgi:hypothetical protein
MEILLEILRTVLPSLMMFGAVYFVSGKWFEERYRLKLFRYQQKKKNITIPLRLQAYERLSLLCERISIPAMIFRAMRPGMRADELRLALLLTIQQEFDHNLTQQIYVSDQLWKIVQVARDETVRLVDFVSERTEPHAGAEVMSEQLMTYAMAQPVRPLEKALEAIRMETRLLLQA